MDQAKKKVLVVGTGGIGGFFGAKLAKAGHEVSFVCRSDVEVVKAQGLQIRSYQGDFHVTPAQVVSKAADYVGQPDLILVATKVLPEVNVPDLIRAVVFPQTSILLIQNGIEIEGPIAQAFPETPLFSAIAFIGVSKIAPGVVHHQLRGNLEIGSYPADAAVGPSEWVDLFVQADVQAKASKNIERSRWKKLIWNLPFNPISVLTQANTAQMLDNPNIRKLVIGVMGEVLCLARARGHHLEDRLIAQNIEATEKMPPYQTSMLLDYLQKRPMEYRAILDTPVNIGIELGVKTPYILALAGLTELLSLEKSLDDTP